MKVLVVDDDPQIVDAIAVAIQFHWHDVEVFAATTGEQGLEKFYEHNPDVILLDVSMPGRNGFDVLQEIRRVSDVPVVMLTARTGETDQVRGLELGADDYIVKPCGHLALLAHIKAVMRRARQQPPASALPDFAAGDLTIDFESQTVRLGGNPISLTAAEYKLLFHLVRSAGRLVTHQALIERIWGSEWGASANSLKALVSRLRLKLEPDSSSFHYIRNERGLGYRFVRPTGGRNGSSAPSAPPDLSPIRSGA